MLSSGPKYTLWKSFGWITMTNQSLRLYNLHEEYLPSRQINTVEFIVQFTITCSSQPANSVKCGKIFLHLTLPDWYFRWLTMQLSRRRCAVGAVCNWQTHCTFSVEDVWHLALTVFHLHGSTANCVKVRLWFRKWKLQFNKNCTKHIICRVPPAKTAGFRSTQPWAHCMFSISTVT